MPFSRVHPKVEEYEVFARRLRSDPLHHVGSVVAPDPELACAYARATYDEERWVELTVVPRQALITVWKPGEEVE